MVNTVRNMNKSIPTLAPLLLQRLLSISNLHAAAVWSTGGILRTRRPPPQLAALLGPRSVWSGIQMDTSSPHWSINTRRTHTAAAALHMCSLCGAISMLAADWLFLYAGSRCGICGREVAAPHDIMTAVTFTS